MLLEAAARGDLLFPFFPTNNCNYICTCFSNSQTRGQLHHQQQWWAVGNNNSSKEQECKMSLLPIQIRLRHFFSLHYLFTIRCVDIQYLECGLAAESAPEISNLMHS
jgi:hypothetical protein